MGMYYSVPYDTGFDEGPFFRLPTTDAFSSFGHWQNTECEDFELRILDCMEAHGAIVGKHKCKLLLQDFRECTTKWKQLRRLEILRHERTKQWMMGQVGLDDRKTPRYINPGPQDGYAPDPLTDLNP